MKDNGFDAPGQNLDHSTDAELDGLEHMITTAELKGIVMRATELEKISNEPLMPLASVAEVMTEVGISGDASKRALGEFRRELLHPHNNEDYDAIIKGNSEKLKQRLVGLYETMIKIRYYNDTLTIAMTDTSENSDEILRVYFQIWKPRGEANKLSVAPDYLRKHTLSIRADYFDGAGEQLELFGLNVYEKKLFVPRTILRSLNRKSGRTFGYEFGVYQDIGKSGVSFGGKKYTVRDFLYAVVESEWGNQFTYEGIHDIVRQAAKIFIPALEHRVNDVLRARVSDANSLPLQIP